MAAAVAPPYGARSEGHGAAVPLVATFDNPFMLHRAKRAMCQHKGQLSDVAIHDARRAVRAGVQRPVGSDSGMTCVVDVVSE